MQAILEFNILVKLNFDCKTPIIKFSVLVLYEFVKSFHFFIQNIDVE